MHAPPISIIEAAGFKKLIDQGYDVFMLNFKPVTPPTEHTHLRAIGNDPAPKTLLHAEPLPISAAEVRFSSVQTPLHLNQNWNRWFGSVQVQLHKLNRPEPVRVVQFAVRTRFGP